MKKMVFAIALAAVMMLAGCSGSGITQEEYNSLVEENSRLKAELEKYSSVSESVSSTDIESTPIESLPESKPEELSLIQKYIKENNVKLDNYDVQYDMENNLDKEFLLVGTAKLDDYYNYGFGHELEKDYFCVSVTPSDGSYKNRWYIYCHRQSFAAVFDNLKRGEIEVEMICYIPKECYKQGQNNMAALSYIVYYTH